MFSTGSISSEEIIKYAHRISASNAVCAPLNWVPGGYHFVLSVCVMCVWFPHSFLTIWHFFHPGDPRRPYPTDLEMRSGILGHMANMPTNGVNGHLPGDALAAGRLPGKQGCCQPDDIDSLLFIIFGGKHCWTLGGKKILIRLFWPILKQQMWYFTFLIFLQN